MYVDLQIHTYIYSRLVCRHTDFQHITYRCINLNTHIYTHIHTYTHIKENMHICIHIYTHIYTYTHIYPLIYTYIHIYTLISTYIQYRRIYTYLNVIKRAMYDLFMYTNTWTVLGPHNFRPLG
jgi:hypothetical protein